MGMLRIMIRNKCPMLLHRILVHLHKITCMYAKLRVMDLRHVWYEWMRVAVISFMRLVNVIHVMERRINGNALLVYKDRLAVNIMKRQIMKRLLDLMDGIATKTG